MARKKKGQFLLLRANLSVEIASEMRKEFRQLPNGLEALIGLTTDDLCIIYLSRFYPDREINRLLGYDPDFTYHITRRKEQLRTHLQESGLKDRFIDFFMPLREVTV